MGGHEAVKSRILEDVWLGFEMARHKKRQATVDLSQMVAYTIFRGIHEKWLDKNYLDYANNMRHAVHQKVDKYGYIQDVCGAPFFESPGRATEGQAFFLLMEAAYKNLLKL